MRRDIQKGMKLVSVYADKVYMLIKLCAIKDLFGIQVIANANAINLAILVNI